LFDMAGSSTPSVSSTEPAARRTGGVAALVLGATGIVFGDIGTSPLYTLQECLHSRHGAAPSPANVFGVVSLVIWSLTLVVTVKYLACLMRADNHGEGGIMALLALVPDRVRRVGRVGPIAALVVVGASLLFGDGIITPAISVLAAMEGLEVATVALKPYVVPLTVGILVGLFALQRRGTGTIGRLFGPVMVLWFVTIAVLGVVHILRRPGILGAVSPHHAWNFFAENGWVGFRVLGGVVLAVTGGEALYADMGHFGRRPIRIAWLGFIYPALILCYLGQGAAVLGDQAGVARPFYALIPPGPWIYAAVALACAATVIASQALISGVFSLVHQGMRLGYFPRVLVKHTSGKTEGQIYLPLINSGLGVACIALVLAFRESAGLAAAYGLAVSGTMAITSVVFYVVTRRAWGWSRLKAGLVLGLFLAVDIPFLAANCLKFLDGGYLPFLVGLGFAWVMVSWRVGRAYLGELVGAQSLTEKRFLASLPERLVKRIPGTLIVMSAQSSGVPAVLERLVKRFRVMHERVVVVTVVTEHVPFVPHERRVSTESVGEGIWRVLLHYGFMQVPHVPWALAEAFAELGMPEEQRRASYLIGRETLVVTKRGRMGRLTEPMFALLSRNARSVTDHFSIPVERVVELGIQADL
jgi:KUP system potassium uptake protein